jgi:hypothetical protein
MGGENIRIYLIEMEWEGVDLVHLSRDVVGYQWRALMNMVMNLRLH